jgi:DNA-binding beta-propeller fold protein YncE
MNPAKVHHLQIGICVCIVQLILIFSANYYGTGSASNGDLADIYSPHGVEVDTLGNVYISDTRNLVQKFDNNGKFILKWGSNGTADGQFLHPHDVSVTRSGYVYIGDYHIPNIQKFDNNGKFILKWGSNGTADGQFLQKSDDIGPEGIDVDSSGNIFVADSGNSRVQKFDNNGKFILKWGSNGTANGQFKYPSGLAVDSSGNVFVSDEGNKNVQKFDSDGKFMTKWGSRGYGDGKFKHNHYIAVDSSGNVYVSDRDYGYVQKFDNNGKFITRWTSETKETDG